MQVADCTNISLALSEVMEEIGVSEYIVKKRRRTTMLSETMGNIRYKMRGENVSVYYFGSLSEGTTTLGLNSDADILFCVNDFNIITDWSEWEHGVGNYLIIRDENTAPGYCMLQKVKDDAPFPLTDSHHEDTFRDQQGRILLRKSFILSERPEGFEQHGPAFAEQGHHGFSDRDEVYAFPCKSLLPEVQQWLSQQTPGRWPTEDMKSYIANSACFVVPAGCRGSVNEDLEWRISTSLPERCLMFSLNITQIKVYVLMKMLLPSININIPKENHISSFMCKTVVLHCIQITDHNAWQSHNLIQCLMFCLSALSICVMNESCPHFIIRANNLMARKFTAEAKHKHLENLRCLVNDLIGHGLFSIQTDDTGKMLICKLTNGIFGMPYQNSISHYRTVINDQLLVTSSYIAESILKHDFPTSFTDNPNYIEQVAKILRNIRYLQKIHEYGNAIESLACTLLVPGFCTTVGSLLASACIQNGYVISQEALDFFSLGLNSDVASSKLKLASVFCCTGDIDKSETVLRDVENGYDLRLCKPICGCYYFPKLKPPYRVNGSNSFTFEQFIRLRTATCVIFLPNEIKCVPTELQYEMFRSTPHDIQHRGGYDHWMDWAVMDSLPYLYYLQYKTFQRLGRYMDQQRALNNLMLAIVVEPNLGHRETAWNKRTDLMMPCTATSYH